MFYFHEMYQSEAGDDSLETNMCHIIYLFPVLFRHPNHKILSLAVNNRLQIDRSIDLSEKDITAHPVLSVCIVLRGCIVIM